VPETQMKKFTLNYFGEIEGNWGQMQTQMPIPTYYQLFQTSQTPKDPKTLLFDYPKTK
jgi:hypothetical protein